MGRIKMIESSGGDGGGVRTLNPRVRWWRQVY